jgi:signal transduction histidine kinase/ActR/RegA family two-component response regulator
MLVGFFAFTALLSAWTWWLSRRDRATQGEFGPMIDKCADGKVFPIEASVAQITPNGRKLDTITCRDITERVEAETTRRILEAQLLQSQKMEAIGLLAAGVAHDFNNLLTVIGGYTESLLAELPVNHAFAEPLKAIQHAGECAASLTRQLLVFSRQNVYDPQVLDINALVVETEKMLRRLIGEDICFIVRTDPSVGSVKADPAQLNQVLVNLAVNARDAMPKGGHLAIEIGSAQGGDIMPGLPVSSATESYVKLSVSDTGVGIPPAILTRIFEPFFTTKSVGKGTGLGLAVVQGIVEQSGGRIEVCSTPDVGTTINIFLPEFSEPLARAQKRPKRRGSGHGSETILLVEDEDVVRRLALTVLESHGYHVLQAADGRDALRLAESHGHGIDMVLTDVVMPNMNGHDVAEALRSRFPKIKVLFMSGYSGDAIHQHGLIHTEIHLLQKPYSTGSLVGKVREVLDLAHNAPASSILA